MQTPATLGNGFGYTCPQCGKGDDLTIDVLLAVRLFPEGTETVEGDHEWDNDSGAACGGCGWSGKVKQFKKVPDFKEE